MLIMEQTIKYRIVHHDNKEYELQVYRKYGDKDEWVMIDRLNNLTGIELKYLADHIYSLIAKNKS